ncbi:unnamed protein product [Bursaphelenchus xylophilus]|uniref:(pine wood nematode) hypothetical protein n=1 Tax=Bursaphelenchus xylophilus TaxID=6326 RepID=A0A7I8XNW1_BURXY|nr:unnamed protein product [Bursaphelenchus xylophilus]CAG9087003.1 unnamed protein product [Bursaphelenchus xylophilus]
MICLVATILTPIILFLPDQDAQREFIASLDPYVAQLFVQHPDMVCFTTGTNPRKSLIVGFLAISVAPFIGVFFLTVMRSSMRRQSWSANTRRLQMMLFRSLVFQLIAFTLFMVIGHSKRDASVYAYL